jgi:hypothetical protein
LLRKGNCSNSIPKGFVCEATMENVRLFGFHDNE